MGGPFINICWFLKKVSVWFSCSGDANFYKKKISSPLYFNSTGENGPRWDNFYPTKRIFQKKYQIWNMKYWTLSISGFLDAQQLNKYFCVFVCVFVCVSSFFYMKCLSLWISRIFKNIQRQIEIRYQKLRTLNRKQTNTHM